jgi:hypothetical protein
MGFEDGRTAEGRTFGMIGLFIIYNSAAPDIRRRNRTAKKGGKNYQYLQTKHYVRP